MQQHQFLMQQAQAQQAVLARQQASVQPAAALCAEHAGQPDRFDFAWQDVGALLPPVRLDAGTATAPLADAPPRRRRRRSNSLQPDGVEAG